MTRLTKLPARYAAMIEQTTDATSLSEHSAASKYGNRKTTVDGHTFDSLAEAEHYVELHLRELAGEISDLRLQPRYVLQEGAMSWPYGEYELRRRLSPITYTADFAYCENGQLVACEVKGKETEAWSIRKRLFQARFPAIRLEVIKVERGGRRR